MLSTIITNQVFVAFSLVLDELINISGSVSLVKPNKIALTAFQSVKQLTFHLLDLSQPHLHVAHSAGQQTTRARGGEILESVVSFVIRLWQAQRTSDGRRTLSLVTYNTRPLRTDKKVAELEEQIGKLRWDTTSWRGLV